MAKNAESESIFKIKKISDELILKLNKSNNFADLNTAVKITHGSDNFRVYWNNILNLDVLITLMYDPHNPDYDEWSINFIDHDSGELVIDKRLEDCGIFYQNNVDDIRDDIIYLAKKLMYISKHPERQEKFFNKLQEQISINTDLRERNKDLIESQIQLEDKIRILSDENKAYKIGALEANSYINIATSLRPF